MEGNESYLDKLRTRAQSKIKIALAQARQESREIIGLERPHREEFVETLAIMIGAFEDAENYIDAGDPESFMRELYGARLCKDCLYNILIRAYAPAQSLQNQGGYTVITGPESLDFMEKIRQSVWTEVIQQTYADLEEKCAEKIEERIKGKIK